jgi:hypothetical protein
MSVMSVMNRVSAQRNLHRMSVASQVPDMIEMSDTVVLVDVTGEWHIGRIFPSDQNVLVVLNRPRYGEREVELYQDVRFEDLVWSSPFYAWIVREV